MDYFHKNLPLHHALIDLGSKWQIFCITSDIAEKQEQEENSLSGLRHLSILILSEKHLSILV